MYVVFLEYLISPTAAHVELLTNAKGALVVRAYIIYD